MNQESLCIFYLDKIVEKNKIKCRNNIHKKLIQRYYTPDQVYSI